MPKKIITDNLIVNTSSTEPTTPSANTGVVYAENLGTKTTLKIKDANGINTSLQDAFCGNNITMWTTTNATGGLWIGTVGTSAGTFANTLPSAGGLASSVKRSLYSNVATTTNQVLGVYGTENIFLRGPVSAFGGFYFYSRFTFDTWTNGGRFFTGLSAVGTATAIITSDPSTATNTHTCGFAVDSTDAGVIYFITNNGTTTTKQIVTGMDAIVSSRVYDAYIYCPPGSSTIYWKFKGISPTATASGSQTLTLPNPSTAMKPYCVASNAALTPVNSIRLGVNKIYIQTDL